MLVFILTLKFLIAKRARFMGSKLFEASYAMPCTNVVKSREMGCHPLFSLEQRAESALGTSHKLSREQKGAYSFF